MKNIRVVDLTSVLSGPFCTWLLGSLGADIIKVESPAGDMARATPPFVEGESLYFASLNRNKRSIVLDLKTEDGKEALRKLLKTADVLIENMRPGVRSRLGFGDEELKQINPKLIVSSISGFGQTGSLSERPGRSDREPVCPKPLICLLYTSPSPRDATLPRMPSSA